MRENGVLISKIGAGDNIKLRPPLVFSRENADLFVDTLDDRPERYRGLAMTDFHTLGPRPAGSPRLARTGAPCPATLGR